MLNMFIYLDNKNELKILLDLIKGYLRKENRNFDYLGREIFIKYIGNEKTKYLKLLFYYFYKLDETIHDIIIDENKNKIRDLEAYINKYETWLFRENEDAIDILIGTLDNIEGL